MGFGTWLRERGYVEGKNLHIEYRWAEGRYERLPGLAQEMLRSNIDLLMSHGSPGSRAAKQATTSVNYDRFQLCAFGDLDDLWRRQGRVQRNERGIGGERDYELCTQGAGVYKQADTILPPEPASRVPAFLASATARKR